MLAKPRRAVSAAKSAVSSTAWLSARFEAEIQRNARKSKLSAIAHHSTGSSCYRYERVRGTLSLRNTPGGPASTRRLNCVVCNQLSDGTPMLHNFPLPRVCSSVALSLVDGRNALAYISQSKDRGRELVVSTAGNRRPQKACSNFGFRSESPDVGCCGINASSARLPLSALRRFAN